MITSTVESVTRATASSSNTADRPAVPERLPGHTFQQALMATVTGCVVSPR
ncbi:hypothetical protein [Mycobacterium mantenii]